MQFNIDTRYRSKLSTEQKQAKNNAFKSNNKT